MKVNLKKLGYTLFHKSFVRITEYNKDKLENKTYIFGPNHTSDLDGPVLWSSNQNMKIMAKKECFENEFMDSFLTSIDVMKVDRNAHNGSAMMEAIKYLKKDDEKKIFMMFPQGTISDINKNTLGRIKEGMFVISALSGVPIVPIFMEQPRFLRRSRIVYGEPYHPDILNERRKIEREKLLEAKAYWQQEILKLQKQAVELEDRPIRKLKLKAKHQNNNNG